MYIIMFLLNKNDVFDTDGHFGGSSGSFFRVPCSIRMALTPSSLFSMFVYFCCYTRSYSKVISLMQRVLRPRVRIPTRVGKSAIVERRVFLIGMFPSRPRLIDIRSSPGPNLIVTSSSSKEAIFADVCSANQRGVTERGMMNLNLMECLMFVPGMRCRCTS
jgi:hypothetical protein